MENRPPKIVVAGMGSELRQDDAFGVLLAQRLKEEAAFPACVTVLEVGSAGMHLVQELMDGYQVLLLLDVVQWGGPAGTLHLKEIDVADVTKLPREEQNRFFADMHYINPLKALMMAKALKVLPQQVFFLGCESEEHDEIGVGLSAAVEAALPLAYQKAKAFITALMQKDERQEDSGR